MCLEYQGLGQNVRTRGTLSRLCAARDVQGTAVCAFDLLTLSSDFSCTSRTLLARRMHGESSESLARSPMCNCACNGSSLHISASAKASQLLGALTQSMKGGTRINLSLRRW